MMQTGGDKIISEHEHGNARDGTKIVSDTPPADRRPTRPWRSEMPTIALAGAGLLVWGGVLWFALFR